MLNSRLCRIALKDSLPYCVLSQSQHDALRSSEVLQTQTYLPLPLHDEGLIVEELQDVQEEGVEFE